MNNKIETLDLLDRRILYELDRNSRQSFTQIARKLRTSKGVVSYRVRQLEEKKIVQGYYASVDTVQLGYYNFRVYVKLKEASPHIRESILHYLVSSPKTWWVATTTFPYDIVVVFLAKSFHEFNGMFKDFLQRFKRNLQQYRVRLYIELRNFDRDYLLHEEPLEKRAYRVLGKENRIEPTSSEMAVLREISTHARTGTVELGKKLKMSPITVRNSIKKMLKAGTIMGFSVNLDHAAIGYNYYWVHMDVKDFDSGQKLAQWITQLPETVHLDETIGGSDVEFGIQIKQSESVENVLGNLFARFGDAITQYEYFKILENKKVAYMPQ